MKRIALAAVLLALPGLILIGCDVDQTREGDIDLPKYEVEKVEEGDVQLPAYDVDAPDIDIETRDTTVTLPNIDVDVRGEEATVPVPDVDINPPAD